MIISLSASTPASISHWSGDGSRILQFDEPPAIDPDVPLRLLFIRYRFGVTRERRLIEEVRMHLGYRWFARLGFEQGIPDHSTFSKNRHGRFRHAGIFLEVFEEIVRRCLEVGLVQGKRLSVDGAVVTANASPRRG